MIINKARHIFQLLIIYLLFLIGGITLIHEIHISLSVSTFSMLLTIMTIITLGAYLLIRLGMKKGEKEQGIYLLGGLGGKFLSYLILILIYWLVTKNLSREFIIAFFVLYLTFTIFLIGVIVKALKIKRL